MPAVTEPGVFDKAVDHRHPKIMVVILLPAFNGQFSGFDHQPLFLLPDVCNESSGGPDIYFDHLFIMELVVELAGFDLATLRLVPIEELEACRNRNGNIGC